MNTEKILKDGMLKAYTLGKIESLELIATMVESGAVTTTDNLKSLVRAIRTSCKEQRAEMGLVEDKDENDVMNNINKEDIERIIQDIKSI